MGALFYCLDLRLSSSGGCLAGQTASSQQAWPLPASQAAFFAAGLAAALRAGAAFAAGLAAAFGQEPPAAWPLPRAEPPFSRQLGCCLPGRSFFAAGLAAAFRAGGAFLAAGLAAAFLAGAAFFAAGLAAAFRTGAAFLAAGLAAAFRAGAAFFTAGLAAAFRAAGAAAGRRGLRPRSSNGVAATDSNNLSYGDLSLPSDSTQEVRTRNFSFLPGSPTVSIFFNVFRSRKAAFKTLAAFFVLLECCSTPSHPEPTRSNSTGDRIDEADAE